MKLINENIPLKDFYFYRAGGTARYLAIPATSGELSEILQWAESKKLNYAAIGSGSNILFSDNVFEGLVIVLGSLNKWIVKKANHIKCGGGVNLNSLIEFTAAAGLKGLEKLYGIPGSVGGSCIMNAGAFGYEISDPLTIVEVMDKYGNKKTLHKNDIKFGYRHSSLTGFFLLSASFDLLQKSSAEIKKDIYSIDSKRNEKQPLEYYSCGSVFKRPENDYAGRLIESCGLKGLSIGGAEVSPKHANFIVNKGNASSSDIYRLIKYVKDVIYRQKGILLEEEVKLINF